LRLFAAILLLGIFLFNLFGYGVLNGLLQEKASRRLEARLDRGQFDESELMTIKVPMSHLAYYNNFSVFERVNGTIEIKGVPCQYVERRIFNDTLELLCIPNKTVLKLRNNGEDYFRLVNDVQQPQQGRSHHVARNFSVDPYTYPGTVAIKDRCFILIERNFDYFLYFPFHPQLPDERPPLAADVA
jgi:hypothetical protein